MHQADGNVGVAREQFEGAVVFQAVHVVDEVNAQFEHRRHHRRFFGVNRDGARAVGDQRLHDGRQAGDFFLCWHFARAGAGGFGTDVDDVRAVGNHLPRVGKGAFRVKPGAAVGK